MYMLRSPVRVHLSRVSVLITQDCEFTYLSTQILHLLGVEGPRTKEPARHIR